MPIALRIIFTVILGLSIIATLIRQVSFIEFDEDEPQLIAAHIASFVYSWAWRITLIVLLWAF